MSYWSWRSQRLSKQFRLLLFFLGCSLQLDRRTLLPEITHFRCKAQKNVLGTELEASSLMTNVPSIRKYYANYCRRKSSRSYPVIYLVCYKTNLLGNICPPMQQCFTVLDLRTLHGREYMFGTVKPNQKPMAEGSHRPWGDPITSDLLNGLLINPLIKV